MCLRDILPLYLKIKPNWLEIEDDKRNDGSVCFRFENDDCCSVGKKYFET